MSTLLANIERLVSSLINPTDYYAVYAAQVTSVNNDGSLDITPQNPRFSGMSEVPLWPGVAGCVATLTAGALVLFSFADGDPGAPYVLGVMGNPQTLAVTADNIYLNPASPAASTLMAARVTDPVSVTTTTTVTQTEAQAIVALAAAPPPGSPVTLTGTGSGSITDGSLTVGIGN